MYTLRIATSLNDTEAVSRNFDELLTDCAAEKEGTAISMSSHYAGKPDMLRAITI